MTFLQWPEWPTEKIQHLVYQIAESAENLAANRISKWFDKWPFIYLASGHHSSLNHQRQRFTLFEHEIL